MIILFSEFVRFLGWFAILINWLFFTIVTSIIVEGVLLVGHVVFDSPLISFIVGTFILFILIELEVIVSRIVELFRDVVIVLLEVIGSVCRLRFLPAAVARRCA